MASVAKKSRSSKKRSASKKNSIASKTDSIASKRDSTAKKRESIGSKKVSIGSGKESVTSRKDSTGSKKVSIASKGESTADGRSSGSKKSVKGKKTIMSRKSKGEDADGEQSSKEGRSKGRYKRKLEPSEERRFTATEGSSASRVKASTGQQRTDTTGGSRAEEQDQKREAREARQAREERDVELGSLGVMEATETEVYVRRQIHAIDAGAAMPLDMTNPAEAALSAILQSVARGGTATPVDAAMRAILHSVTGAGDVRLVPEVREFMQHVLDKATGLLDVDPDSEVGQALFNLVAAVQEGKADAVVASQLALKMALERALKAPIATMPTRVGDAAVGRLIATDTLEMALMSVDEALLTGRARIILQEAKDMRRRGEDIWTFMLRMQYESSSMDRRMENIRKWKRMGGITQVPWTPTKRRGPIAAEYQSPGPACVALPNLIGGVMCVPDSKRARAPAFTFGSRHGGKNDSPGPGPGQYNVTGLSAKGKDNPPASSLHSRPKGCKSDQTPAPGDYNPEKSEKMVHDNSPRYTFGLKTLHEKPSSTPAPNVYNIPTVLGATKEGNKKQAPAFTISGRQKEKPDDRVFNPGPGSYNNSKADNYKMRSPAYSISSRYQMPTDSTQKPGPGAHSPEKVYLNRRWVPNYSFGIKHTQYKGDKGFVLVTERPRPTYACTC